MPVDGQEERAEKAGHHNRPRGVGPAGVDRDHHDDGADDDRQDDLHRGAAAQRGAQRLGSVTRGLGREQPHHVVAHAVGAKRHQHHDARHRRRRHKAGERAQAPCRQESKREQENEVRLEQRHREHRSAEEIPPCFEQSPARKQCRRDESRDLALVRGKPERTERRQPAEVKNRRALSRAGIPRRRAQNGENQRHPDPVGGRVTEQG